MATSYMPPTPGYREDPDHPLESAALLPQAVIDLAIEKQKEEKERPTGDATVKSTTASAR